jgi:GTPase SAR1 family protein
MGHQGCGKTSLIRCLKQSLEFKDNPGSFLTEFHPDLLRTELVDIIENIHIEKNSEESYPTKFHEEDEGQITLISQDDFKVDESDDSEPGTVKMTAYDMGGHSPYYNSQRIFRSNGSTYFLTFDG